MCDAFETVFFSPCLSFHWILVQALLNIFPLIHFNKYHQLIYSVNTIVCAMRTYIKYFSIWKERRMKKKIGNRNKNVCVVNILFHFVDTWCQCEEKDEKKIVYNLFDLAMAGKRMVNSSMFHFGFPLEPIVVWSLL